MKRMLFALASACLAAGAPATAETLTMTGTFPAPAREAAMLRSIAVERLGGRDGAQVGMAIERALARPDADTIAYFDVVYGGRRADGSLAEGTLSGAVSSGVEDSRYQQPRKRCAEKDKDGKCTKEVEDQINCTLRVANLTADLRIVRNADNATVYSASKPLRREVRWCQGQSAPATQEEMIAAMITDVAEAVRADTIPVSERYSIRILESARGIPKEHVRRFKDTIRLTQRSPGQACQDWAALNALIPGNAAILFNVGLCAEWAGELEAARGWYEQAAPLLGRNGGDAATGIRRVERRMVANADLAERRSRP